MVSAIFCRRDPGLSPRAIVPSITRWTRRSLQSLVGRSLYTPRKDGASFADGRLDALTLCLLEGLGIRHVMMRWSMRCRRWKPMIRKRRSWCAVRTSVKRSWPRVQVTHPYSTVSTTSVFSGRTFRVHGHPPCRTASSRLNRL